MSSASSASLASAALVRRMKPPPVASSPAAARASSSAWTSAIIRARSCSRSSCEPIFCEMPMCWSCGRKTSSRPAIETCVDSRAPLVPIGSLITCTVSVWPSKMIRSIGGGGTAPGEWSPREVPPLTWTSAMCRNAARSRPISTNADCMPGSTRATLPV